MTGNNIGAMLTKANISWGFFEGGFDLTKTNANGSRPPAAATPPRRSQERAQG